MAKTVAGYNLNAYELGLEIGEEATLEEVKAQADLIASKWPKEKSGKKNPFLLMLGGFQGSGKTTTLEILTASQELVVISPDEIRHNLFAQKYPFSDDFVRLVSATKFELLRRALREGTSATIDQSLTPDRIKITKEILKEYPEYRFLSVFLSTPLEELKKRVEVRPQIPGKYRGTVSELEATVKRYIDRYGDPTSGGYDMLIDTSTHTPQDVARLIRQRIEG